MDKIDKDTVKFLKGKQAENAERQDRVCKEYFRLIKERPEEQVLPELMDRFVMGPFGEVYLYSLTYSLVGEPYVEIWKPRLILGDGKRPD